MIIREGLVKYKGKPIILTGDSTVSVGDKVPAFRLSRSVVEDLEIASLKPRTVVLNVVPSLDTPVCTKQAIRFNREALGLGDGIAIVNVSMDLPFAIQRWCDQHDVQNLETTSDYKYQEFGRAFGIQMRGLGLLARSVFVIDGEGTLRYEQIVPDMGEEPDYDAALVAVRGASAAG